MLRTAAMRGGERAARLGIRVAGDEVSFFHFCSALLRDFVRVRRFVDLGQPAQESFDLKGARDATDLAEAYDHDTSAEPPKVVPCAALGPNPLYSGSSVHFLCHPSSSHAQRLKHRLQS
jgi:hypothetical protein